MSISHEQALANLAHYTAKKKREARQVKRKKRLEQAMVDKHRTRATLDTMFTIGTKVGRQTCALLHRAFPPILQAKAA